MEIVNNIKYLSQQDKKWSDVILGAGSLRMGRYGCTTTCISMLTDYFNCYQTPAQIARNLKNYSGDSNINWIGLDFPTFSFRWREGQYFNAKPVVDMEMVKSYMVKGNQGNKDRAVLLEVANGSHWVVGLWPVGDDILAIDPWTGKTCNVLETYKNITGAALFVRWSNKKKKAWQGAGKPVAPLYN